MKNKEYWLYKIVKSKIQKDRQELNEWAYIQDKCYKVPKNLEMIKAAGCQMAQGFYYAKPMDENALLDFYHQQG